MLKFLISYKQKSKLRNNVKVSIQIGWQISQSKPSIGKIDYIIIRTS